MIVLESLKLDLGQPANIGLKILIILDEEWDNFIFVIWQLYISMLSYHMMEQPKYIIWNKRSKKWNNNATTNQRLARTDELLYRASFERLALTDGEEPYIVPLSYDLYGGQILKNGHF